MRFRSLTLVSLIVLLVSTIPALAASHKRHNTSSKSSKVFSRHASKTRLRGQRSIDDQRATEIQEALIKAGYLTGEPSGHWGSESQSAMQKLQADNGWQTKLVPDSRALIKLGLGPSSTSAPSSLDSTSGEASIAAQTFAGVNVNQSDNLSSAR